MCERLGLLLDILVAHKDLCERLEKGLHHDHAVALSKLLSLKKRKIQGVIRGTDVREIMCSFFLIIIELSFRFRRRVWKNWNPRC